MLKANRLKRKLSRGERAIGLFASLPTPVSIEMIGHAGFDFVIIDTEHSLVNPETLENMLRAAELVELTCLVRVSAVDARTLVPLLDGGAQGIVVANVESPETLRTLNDIVRFHPMGRRGMNSGRPGRFGAGDLVEYLQRANDEVMVVPMIESRAGVERLEAILQVPGIDMVLEGAADLSQSFGIPWQTEAPAVVDALDRVFACCRRENVPYCAIPRTLERREHWMRKGVGAFVLGDERGIAFRALQAAVRPFKECEPLCAGREATS